MTAASSVNLRPPVPARGEVLRHAWVRVRLGVAQRGGCVDDTVAEYVHAGHRLRCVEQGGLSGRGAGSLRPQQGRDAADKRCRHRGAVQLTGAVGTVGKQRGRILRRGRPDRARRARRPLPGHPSW